MSKYLFVLVFVALSANTSAQLYKCKGADGKVQFSDTACKAGSASELIPDRAPVTPQQRYEAQQRAQQMRDEAAALEHEEASVRARSDAGQRHLEAQADRRAAATQSASDAGEAINDCIRDVERRGTSQDVKAELIAACRTAAFVQGSTGISGDAVKDCVRNVERTAASEWDKARQIAMCHGGAVPPEPEVIVVRPPVRKPRTLITSCLNEVCRDQFGNSYRKDAIGNLTRTDGQRCRVHGKSIECD
jgi:hypothetical protein